MKILERGDMPMEKLYTIRCKQCQSKFEFIGLEAKFVSDQRDGDYLKVNCPVCKTACTTSV